MYCMMRGGVIAWSDSEQVVAMEPETANFRNARDGTTGGEGRYSWQSGASCTDEAGGGWCETLGVHDRRHRVGIRSDGVLDAVHQ